MIDFLTKRVTKVTEYDWWKLKRVLKWLKHTIGDKRYMGMDDSGIVQTWSDALYAVYKNMKGRTCGLISMGHGVLTENSLEHKFNSKNTTEKEVVVVSDFLPHNIWLRHFWNIKIM